MWLCDWLEFPRLGIVHMRALGAACMYAVYWRCVEWFCEKFKSFFLVGYLLCIQYDCHWFWTLDCQASSFVINFEICVMITFLLMGSSSTVVCSVISLFTRYRMFLVCLVIYSSCGHGFTVSYFSTIWYLFEKKNYNFSERLTYIYHTNMVNVWCWPYLMWMLKRSLIVKPAEHLK